MPSHRLHHSIVAGLAVAALAAPAAHAAPILDPGSGESPQSSGVEIAPEPVAADSPAVTTTIDEGFDWGSAAIGAGGAGALIALVSLGGFAYSARGRVPVPR